MVRLLANHKYLDEAGNIVRIFFPGVKIVTDADINKMIHREGVANCRPYCVDAEKGGDFEYTVISELGDTEAFAEVNSGEGVLASYSWPFYKTDGFLTKSRMLMLSLFFALQSVKPTGAPWGALTGIRPTKLVRQWLDMGVGENEAEGFLQNPYQVTKEKAELAIMVAKAENRIKDLIFSCGEKTAGFYINIPFCASRCLYCSFTCMEKPPSEGFMEEYVNVLVDEIGKKLEEVQQGGFSVSSIYIGGGTPTFLPQGHLHKILKSLEGILYDGLEFTVEGGRPDSVTEDKLRLFKENGVTRFSVNPQTLNDDTLQRIGRWHTAKDFFKAYALAKKIGFLCISSDIIAGLPGEGVCDVEKTLKGLIRLAPENITVHNLAIKRASKLKTVQKSMYEEASMQHTRDMVYLAQKSLVESGYTPYYLYRQKDMLGLGENVGYSRDGFWCLYNIGMMSEVQTVFGAGAGAVTKYVVGDKITRKFNIKNPEHYVKQARHCV